MVLNKTTHSIEETKALGKRLAQSLNSGDVITLSGELGAGKTTFTQGIAEGLEIQDVVNSPTFTIIKEYNGVFPLYHMDTYRLEDEFEDLGFEEYFSGEGVTVVEWADRIQPFLPKALLHIDIKRIDENVREFLFYPHGERYEAKVEELQR